MRKLLSNSEKRELNNLISCFDFSISKKDKVELVEDGLRLISVNEKVMFFYSGEDILPTLKTVIEQNISMKKIVVDMGAVKFVASGADIMRPGIVDMDDFEKDAFVVIVDETHKKPLAIGQAKVSSEELKAADKGKLIKNLHHVGDKIWDY